MHPFEIDDEEAADMKKQLMPLLTIVIAKKRDGEDEASREDEAEDAEESTHVMPDGSRMAGRTHRMAYERE